MELAHINEYVENAWLNLGDTSKIITDNLFHHKTDEEIEKPHEFLLSLMMKPENFAFTCKHLLNKTMTPMQLVILYELWTKPFPMLLGSRGFGKSFMLGTYIMLRLILCQGSKIVVVGSAFRQAKVVFEYCEEIWLNSPILRDICGEDKRCGPRRDIDRCTMKIGDSIATFLPLGSGEKIRGQRANIIIAEEFACLDRNTLVETDKGLIRISDCENLDIKCNNKDGVFEKPSRFITTPKTDVYEVKTVCGYSFKCSNIHKVLTMNGWKFGKDLTEDDYLIFDNKYKFPEKSLITDNEAWLLGALVSEGSVNHKSQIQVIHTDKSFVDRIIESIQNINGNITKYSLNYRNEYEDKRGWKCKPSWRFSVYNKDLRERLFSMGLDYDIALDKKIPKLVLQSSRKTVLRFLSSLFEGDGTCFIWHDKTRNIQNRIGLAYYSSSLQLCQEVQIILKKLGYLSSIQSRPSDIYENLQYMVRLNGKYAYDLAIELNIPKQEWVDSIKNCYEVNADDKEHRIVFDKSRNQWKVDITICGKNKFIGRYSTYEEAEKEAIKHTPTEHIRVKSVRKLDYQDNLYDFYLPKTNSFYANGFVQHNSIPVEIFENVVSGFAAVSLSPVEKMKAEYRKKTLSEMGLYNTDKDNAQIVGLNTNQTILSGTAYYGFNHFYKYWKRYKAIIESQGDKRKLEEIFDGEIPVKFNYKDYSIIRIPVELLPEGFMDEKHVSKAKVTQHLSQYLMEYAACFCVDSNGFFKRSLIEKCVVGKPETPIYHPSCGEVKFNAMLKSDKPDAKCVMAIDPASEQDNFSIVILECHPDHRRIVYCWTTTKKKHKEKLKTGLVQEEDFYGYCARKARELLDLFNCQAIAMDSQGGGYAVAEVFSDRNRLKDGEQPIYHIIEDDTERDTDNYPGLHILKMINFAQADWVRDANHGMRKDFEDKTLLFPEFNSAILGLAYEEDSMVGRTKTDGQDTDKMYDTLEDCVMEIEELKDELATIVHSQTGTSLRDRWDTPEVKQPGVNKKGKLRKDRYSALLMANMLAREIHISNNKNKSDYQWAGGFSKDLIREKENYKKRQTQNPFWYTQQVGNPQNYGVVARR